MPFSTFEFGLLFASVLLLGWRLHRFSSPHKALPFLSSYLLCSFWTSKHVPLRFGDSLAKDPMWGSIRQPPAANSFQSSGSKWAQPKPRIGHGTGNLLGTRFCARVSSKLPRIENPR